MPCFAVIMGVILKWDGTSVISPYLPVHVLSFIILLTRLNQGVGNGQVCGLHWGHEKIFSDVWLKKPESEEPPVGSRHLE
jgi:hypothetical protein